jgi:hypothetical protein
MFDASLELDPWLALRVFFVHNAKVAAALKAEARTSRHLPQSTEGRT